MYRFWLPLIVPALVLIGACASMNTAGSSPNVRTYALPIDTVIRAASDAFVEAGLALEEGDWANDSTFVIVGNQQSRVLGTNVQVSPLRVFIASGLDDRTRVRMEEPQKAISAAASSADQETRGIRTFFRLLDEKLGTGAAQ